SARVGASARQAQQNNNAIKMRQRGLVLGIATVRLQGILAMRMNIGALSAVAKPPDRDPPARSVTDREPRGFA
ncbi:MAG: hypothetical protein ACREH9_13850, partial [Pseudomonadota bacterium]